MEFPLKREVGFIKSPWSGVTLCFLFVLATSAATAKYFAFASELKSICADHTYMG